MTTRIVKTHLPSELCPFSDAAKYVYVARHAVSCFSSCVDFIRHDAGSFAPSIEACEEWFTSDDSMWWSTWPKHVSGWWQRRNQHGNVLFVRFEDMKQDLAGVAAEVAEFLNVRPLSASEMAQVVRKCSFQYMRDNEECFEMSPPHLLHRRGGQLVSGKTERRRDLPEDVRQRVAQWCRSRLASTNLPPWLTYSDPVGSAREASAEGLVARKEGGELHIEGAGVGVGEAVSAVGVFDSRLGWVDSEDFVAVAQDANAHRAGLGGEAVDG